MQESQPTNKNEKDPQPSLARIYAGINNDGHNAIKENTVPEFEGFGDEFKNRLNVWAEFSEQSQKEFEKRVTLPLQELESNLNVKLFITPRDFQLHSSILQASVSEESKKEDVFSSLQKNEVLGDIGTAARNLTIPFKYLLFDKKGTVILTSVEIPEEITTARAQITEEYRKENVQALPIPILHITVARIRELPSNNQEEVLREFEKKFRDLRHAISSNPLEMSVENFNLALGGVAKGGVSKKLD